MIFPTDLKCDPADIETRGILRDGVKQYIRSRVGILLSLYFLSTYEKRQAILNNLQEYTELFADSITHYKLPHERRYRKWDRKGVPRQYREAANSGDDEEFFYCHMIATDSSESYDPSLWRFVGFGFGEKSVVRPISGIKAHFPPRFVFEMPDRFVTLVRRWAGRLDAVHGSACCPSPV